MADQLTVNDWLIPAIFGNWSVVLLLMMPALSMRIFAEDIRQRSFELLLSSPLTSSQIVFGKFLGALGFLAVLFASTLYQPAVLFWLGSPDPGVLAASYASMFLLSAACLTVGMWVSAYTSNQIVAFIVSFSILLLLYLLGWVGTVTDEGLLGALGKASMLSHLEQLGKGLLHTKDIAYFAAFIGFFVFATVQRVEGFRWSVGLGGGSRTLSDAAWDMGAGVGLLFVLSKVIRLARDGTAGVWEGTANLAWLGLATTGLVLVAAWAWRNRDGLTASAAEPGARLMAGSAALVTVGLGVAVGGYALAERYDRRFDLTASQRFTLSDQTKSLVGALAQDVQVLGFFAPGSPEESKAKDLLAGYTAISPRIDVAFHDPQAEPMLARQYEIAHDYGTLILQSGDRKQRIESGFSEEKLTNALLRLGDQKTHTLCFTSGHDELDPNDDMEPTGVGLAVRKAEGQNYTAKTVVLAREPAVPADCSVLVVADPRLDFLPVERERAAAWVAGGGAMFVLLKPTSAPALAADLARYGVQVGNDIVVEQNPSYAVAGNDPTWVVLDPQSFDVHPITEKLKGAVMLRAARSVGKAAAVPEGLAVQELARTTAYGWGETDLANPALALDPATDRPGPVPLMVAVEVKDPVGLTVGDTTLAAGDAARPVPALGVGAAEALGPRRAAGSRWRRRTRLRRRTRRRRFLRRWMGRSQRPRPRGPRRAARWSSSARATSPAT
jgi:hypothetical protein